MQHSTIFHIILHFAVPGLIAWIFFKNDFKKSWLIMISTMIVDLDHLLADPVFDPNRCSIGFHPLHSVAAIGIYALMAVVCESKIVRLAGTGLIIHMILDGIDCIC
ncbi:Uncharacterized protein dnl_38800 [Desulfonema limicola]|uniref:Uncharacterized protein n=1 Tax=Desulfonema limicola TaxID=45656 RepID=A0A975BA78_9BACT|nr:DUF6122 family protein [Desulfonema limicola]QTA81542.1 Uncharacterized protein dnl_38800 [Desulfonema limicola]